MSTWRKSSRSDSSGNECVEIMVIGGLGEQGPA